MNDTAKEEKVRPSMAIGHDALVFLLTDKVKYGDNIMKAKAQHYLDEMSLTPEGKAVTEAKKKSDELIAKEEQKQSDKAAEDAKKADGDQHTGSTTGNQHTGSTSGGNQGQDSDAGLKSQTGSGARPHGKST